MVPNVNGAPWAARRARPLAHGPHRPPRRWLTSSHSRDIGMDLKRLVLLPSRPRHTVLAITGQTPAAGRTTGAAPRDGFRVGGRDSPRCAGRALHPGPRRDGACRRPHLALTAMAPLACRPPDRRSAGDLAVGRCGVENETYARVAMVHFQSAKLEEAIHISMRTV